MLHLNDIHRAHERIWNHVLHTPTIYSEHISDKYNREVYLKLESEQYTGSFKVRGALNKILASDKSMFYTASTGNHAQGVARALNMLSKPGKIFMPENAVKSKVEAVRSYGVEVEFYGADCLQTELWAQEQAEKDKACYVSPYNDLDVMAGQGTIALEIIDDVPKLDAVVCCVGGGGLVSGVGTGIKALKDGTRVVGVMPENSPEMYLSVKANRFVTVEPKETLSDGSVGGFEEGALTFDVCKKVVDYWELVSEEEIKEGIRLLAKTHHKMIEGAAAVALMGALKSDKLKGKSVAVVICGANMDLDKFGAIISE